jgi:hypothetical protein
MRIKFNLAHGFPEVWDTSKLEKRIILNHLQHRTYDLVVNQTWGFMECENPVTKKISNKFEIVEYLINNGLAKNMLFFNFVDPIYDLSTWYDVFDRCKKYIKDSDIVCIGQMDSNKIRLDYPFVYWSVFTADHFKRYTEEETAPQSFDNLFLCYNRKPHWHRTLLYEQFKKHQLLKKGIFTLGNTDPNKIKLVNADFKTLPSADKNMHGELGIPNDTMTLGDINLWCSHLLTIVTETQHVPNIGFPFFSEKIWKPMIGMRPFLLIGDAGSIRYLQEQGFHTFNKEFDIHNDDASIDDVVGAVKNFTGDTANLYNSLLPKLRHNKKRFYEFALEQKKLFNL